MSSKIEMTIPAKLLGLSDIEVIDVIQRTPRELLIRVKSTTDKVDCKICGKPCDPHGHDRPIEFRHLSMFGYQTFIEITPKRGICKHCDNNPTTTQTLDWYDRKSHQTKPYEQYLLFELINSTVADVSRKEDIDEDVITGVLDRNISTEIDFSLIRPYLKL